MVNISFEHVQVEAMALVLLCNLSGNIRLYAFRILDLVRSVAMELREKEGKPLDTTVADVLDEKASYIAQKIANHNSAVSYFLTCY